MNTNQEKFPAPLSKAVSTEVVTPTHSHRTRSASGSLGRHIRSDSGEILIRQQSPSPAHKNKSPANKQLTNNSQTNRPEFSYIDYSKKNNSQNSKSGSSQMSDKQRNYNNNSNKQ